MNLAEFLDASAARHGDRAAVTDVRSGHVLSYGRLAEEANRVARFLAARGVERAQRIALIAPNAPAYLAAAFGVLATGACIVPVPVGVAPAEMARIMTEIDVNGCLAAPDSGPGTSPGESVAIPDGICEGFAFRWTDRGAPGAPELARLNPAFIRFTSGTTARSKGVVLSHEATASRIAAADRLLQLDEHDRILWVLPLAYHFAVTIVAYARAGANILMGPDTLPAAMVDAIRRLRPTVLYASPVHFERMGNLTSRTRLDGVRVCLSTSAPITASVIERFESGYGVPVGQAYGIIEAGLPCINLRTDGVALTSVGRAVPGYEVEIFSDDGERQPLGTPGEVAVRGTGLFSAYYAPWQLRDHVVRDGWFRTGDIGWLDESHALHLEGRTKTVIFVAGFKFFPEEVEACIDRFPGVRESRVFGRAHARLGEIPCAEIAVDSGCDLDGLKHHCARALSSYKLPVEWRVVDAVPRTPGGKILRRSLRDAV